MQLVSAGRSPVDKRIRGQMEQEYAGKGLGPLKRVRCFGGKVERSDVQDARDERQRGLRRAGRTSGKGWTGPRPEAGSRSPEKMVILPMLGSVPQ